MSSRSTERIQVLLWSPLPTLRSWRLSRGRVSEGYSTDSEGCLISQGLFAFGPWSDLNASRERPYQ
jgi:hypothetical protein